MPKRLVNPLFGALFDRSSGERVTGAEVERRLLHRV